MCIRDRAFDAATGRPLWTFDPKVPGAYGIKACCDVVNRGVAVWKGRVFVGTIDGGLTPDVQIEGNAAATKDSTATNTPGHIPTAGPFQKSPSNSATIRAGSATVEINGKAGLSCTRKMQFLEGAMVITMEGIPYMVRPAIANAFVEKGAVQCGFCTPGLIMRTKILFSQMPDPDREQIKKAISLNLCRCTGYVKIVDAIEDALKSLRKGVAGKKMTLQGDQNKPVLDGYHAMPAGIGHPVPKYEAYETAIGQRKFVNDMSFEGMLHGALRFSDHPRARVISVDPSEALMTDGVIRIFTASDVPGERFTGLIYNDWHLMIAPGEITH